MDDFNFFQFLLMNNKIVTSQTKPPGLGLISLQTMLLAVLYPNFSE
jgi:hypothetical protein